MATDNTPQTVAPLLLTPRDVQKLSGLSVVTIRTLRKQGNFPQPLRISNRRIAWRRDDIEQWIDTRQRVQSFAQPSQT